MFVSENKFKQKVEEWLKVELKVGLNLLIVEEHTPDQNRKTDPMQVYLQLKGGKLGVRKLLLEHKREPVMLAEVGEDGLFTGEMVQDGEELMYRVLDEDRDRIRAHARNYCQTGKLIVA